MRNITFKKKLFSVKLRVNFYNKLTDYLWFEKARTGVSLSKQVEKMLGEYMENHPLKEWMPIIAKRTHSKSNTKIFMVSLTIIFYNNLKYYLWTEKKRTGVSLPKQVENILSEYMKNHPLGGGK